MSGRAKGAVAGMPGWVKVFVFAGLALAVLLAILMLSGHGPWQHVSGYTPTPR